MTTTDTPRPDVPGPRSDTAEPALPHALPRRQWRTPVILWVLAVVALLGFALTAPVDRSSAFGLSTGGQAIQLPDLVLPTLATTVVLGLLLAGLAAYATVLANARRGVPLWVGLVAGAAFLLSFLTWAAEGQRIPFTNLLQGALFLATPLVFGALSGVLCERAGVINISIEGQLLSGAFTSAVVASLTGNVYVGLLAAPVAGLFFGWLLAVFAIRYVVDQIVLGVVLNVLVIGLTSFLYGQVLVNDADTWNQPGRLPRVAVPGLVEIPVLGPVLFNQSLIVYLMYAAVIAVHVGLFRTRWGLRVRAVGEHPKAADTAGIDVNRLRFRNVLLGGAVAGLGGAFFTLGSVGAFGEEMTAGQGFIALAALIFGRWSPVGALLAALLFGFAANLQSTLSIIGTPIPGEFLLMAPYLVTIFAVAGLVGKVRAPAADGVPYRP
ncbi:ABC transporter permease [Aquipuribacter nitratireducens]|uniref:ABC transporter permease n=1 Tax=Aquipuribacter nitratireducens TaxID=650104 RepID=A0ABW0GJY2_9MICO